MMRGNRWCVGDRCVEVMGSKQNGDGECLACWVMLGG